MTILARIIISGNEKTVIKIANIARKANETNKWGLVCLFSCFRIYVCSVEELITEIEKIHSNTDSHTARALNRLRSISGSLKNGTI